MAADRQTDRMHAAVADQCCHLSTLPDRTLAGVFACEGRWGDHGDPGCARPEWT
jgi:hypothetical protein